MRVNLTIMIFMLFSTEAFSGAWGTGSFENDTASDLVYEIESTKGSEVLLSSIGGVFKADYKDADVCSNAIAAAEVIAAIKNGDSNNLPESLVKWVMSNKSIYEPEMAKFALKAVEACKSTTNSELAQLWSEGDPNGWVAHINMSEYRLKTKRITTLSN